MRFAQKWLRYVGSVPAGGIVVGADAVPTGQPAPPTLGDNTLRVPFRADRPFGRLVIGYTYAGAGPAPALTVETYQYERQSDAWYRIQAAQALAVNVLTVMQLVGGLLPNNQPPGQDMNGDVYIRVITSGADPNGVYTFVADVDQNRLGTP